ncbi:MAG: amidohydrolase family protein [Rhodobacteraceae bacterium]|nr:amidohydrolase family protein [Paracoccaceae bacterium]
MTAIVDAHHHIWRQADLPWLLGPEQPRIFGRYGPLRRDYAIAEYLADIAGTGVVRSVYVQANWAPGRGLEEARWVASVAAAHGFPHATVAFADLLAPDCADRLAALAAVPGVRGVRQQLHWHANPQYRFAARPDLALDPMLRANLARLPALGLVFELQVFASQVAAAVSLARALPGVQFVLMHAGMPEDPSAAGRAEWRTGLAALAACPNVATKLSALGTFVHAVDPALIAEVTAVALDAFGPERCAWGSNFPIEKLWTDYRRLLDAHLAALARLAAADRRAVLHDTATRLYRL